MMTSSRISRIPASCSDDMVVQYLPPSSGRHASRKRMFRNYHSAEDDIDGDEKDSRLTAQPLKRKKTSAKEFPLLLEPFSFSEHPEHETTHGTSFRGPSRARATCRPVPGCSIKTSIYCGPSGSQPGLSMKADDDGRAESPVYNPPSPTDPCLQLIDWTYISDEDFGGSIVQLPFDSSHHSPTSGSRWLRPCKTRETRWSRGRRSSPSVLSPSAPTDVGKKAIVPQRCICDDGDDGYEGSSEWEHSLDASSLDSCCTLGEYYPLGGAEAAPPVPAPAFRKDICGPSANTPNSSVPTSTMRLKVLAYPTNTNPPTTRGGTLQKVYDWNNGQPPGLSSRAKPALNLEENESDYA